MVSSSTAVADGQVRLPCDGQTTVPMTLSLSARFGPGDPPAAVVPVWIGRLGIFTCTALVRDVMTFVAPAQTGPWVPVTHAYTLQCTNGCQLTPSGPASGRYTPEGDDVKNLFADRF